MIGKNYGGKWTVHLFQWRFGRTDDGGVVFGFSGVDGMGLLMVGWNARREMA